MPAFVNPVVASEIGIPLHRHRTKVITNVGLEHMRSFACRITEIAVIGRIEPIISNADVQPSRPIRKSKVKFLGITWDGNANASPCGKRHTFIC